MADCSTPRYLRQYLFLRRSAPTTGAVAPAKPVPECLYRGAGAHGPNLDSRLRGNDAEGGDPEIPMISAGRHLDRIFHAKIAKIAKTDTDRSLLFLPLLGALCVLGVKNQGLVSTCLIAYSPGPSAAV